MISLTWSLALGRHDCCGNQRKIHRNASENPFWRFSWYFKRVCVPVHAGWIWTHTSKMAMQWLKERFPEKLILLKSEFIWPPRSPDLNPLHFYPLRYMKDEIRRKIFLLQWVKWRIKSRRSWYKFLLKFCSASSDNSDVRIRNCIAVRVRLFEK